MLRVKEEQFRSVVQPALGEYGERALAVFKNYGPNLSHDVANVLLHAIGQEKVEEVLKALEEGRNSEQIFLDICKNILGLKPSL